MKKVLLLSFLIIAVLSISGCMNTNKSKSAINQKIDTEICYIDNELIFIANSLNNIDYPNYKIEVQEVQKKSSELSSSKEEKSQEGGNNESGGKESQSENKQSEEDKMQKYSLSPNTILGKDKEINWEELTKKIELFYSSWVVISKDLKHVGIQENQIIEFDKKIDMLAISIKNNDKNRTLESVVDLYQYLPEFSEYNKNDKIKRIFESKYNLLVCYKNVSSEEWEQFGNSITNLKMSFSNVSSKKSEYKGQETNIDNITTIIKEMESTAELKEQDIFFVKYKNMLKELNIISLD